MILLLSFPLLLLLIVLALLVPSWVLGVVPMPTLKAERRRILEALGVYREKDYKAIVDLGSGWGGLTRDISHQFPLKAVMGLEGSWLPWAFSRLRFFGQSKGPRIKLGDFLRIPLASHTLYVCYLSGPAMAKLRRRFEEDQPRGGLLVSLAFAMPGWSPSLTLGDMRGLSSRVYVYEL
jgi:hypothetical protein